MRFMHQGKRILLKGVKDDLTSCTQVPAHKLKGLLKKGAITHMLELQHATTVTSVNNDCALLVAAIE